MEASSLPNDHDRTPLAEKLAARIAAGGAISVHDYTEACLYDPEHGYYRKKNAIGRNGDFITAPEISQVFGELVGLWAGEVWRLMGDPAPIRLVELGPGRGTLMSDALRALRVLPRFLESAAVHLIESSEPLQNAQKAALASVSVPVFWHDDLNRVPDGPAIIIANEFFDCLPAQQFVFDAAAGGWRERMVTVQEGAFRFVLGASLTMPGGLPSPAQDEIEDGAICEQRPGAAGVVRAFARPQCAALIIDYGYSRPSFGDTVQAVRHHRFTGLFDAPGRSDITSHVDFFHLKQATADANLAAFGPMPMGEWLLRLGLEARVRQLLARASEEEANEIRSRVTRLVDPAQMGVLFKVLALTNGVLQPPPAFWTTA